MRENLSFQDDSLPKSARMHIEKVCIAFENAWKSQSRPQITQYLRNTPEPELSVLVGRLVLLDLVYRCQCNEKPTSEEYQQKFPDHDTVVRKAFDCLQSGINPSSSRALSETTIYRQAVSEKARVFSEGETIGRFLVGKVLGKGAFGTVYLALDEDLKRQVAIKVSSRRFESEDDVNRFLAEARTAAGLKHPGIVPIYHLEKHQDGTPFVVMEYVGDKSLADVLKKEQLSFANTAKLVAAVADAIAYAHKRDVYHRDLKPANIMLDGEGKPRIVDFGLALHEGERYVNVRCVVGTLVYMAPEQVRGDSHLVDGRADIWALGVIFYEMLTGRRPFGGEDAEQLANEILNREPKPPRQINDEIPKVLEQICLRCLSKEMKDRYATASDISKDLRRWLQPRRRFITILAAVLSILVLSWLFATWHFGHGSLDRNQMPSVSDSKAIDRNQMPSVSDSKALTASIDVQVWDPGNPNLSGLHLGDKGVLPLRNEDRIRVVVKLNQPAYVYLVWVDSEGTALPMYPWKPGCWTERPLEESPIKRLSLPEEGEKWGWPMQGSPGMETVMLFVRESPLSAEFDLAKLLQDLPVQPAQNPRALVRFEEGKVVSRTKDRLRGLDFSNMQEIDDSVLRTQEALYEKLHPHFMSIHAVSFAKQSHGPPR